MKAVLLKRIDPTKNMARFYKIDLQPTLFGEWAVVREWGRIGSGGRVARVPYPSPEIALAAYEQQRVFKLKRGYQASLSLNRTA